MVTLTKVIKVSESKYTFESVSINPDAVNYIEPDFTTKSALQEGKFHSELNENTDFSLISLGPSGRAFTVVGDVAQVSKKLNSGKRLLKG